MPDRDHATKGSHGNKSVKLGTQCGRNHTKSKKAPTPRRGRRCGDGEVRGQLVFVTLAIATAIAARVRGPTTPSMGPASGWCSV